MEGATFLIKGWVLQEGLALSWHRIQYAQQFLVDDTSLVVERVRRETGLLKGVHRDMIKSPIAVKFMGLVPSKSDRRGLFWSRAVKTKE